MLGGLGVTLRSFRVSQYFCMAPMLLRICSVPTPTWPKKKINFPTHTHHSKFQEGGSRRKYSPKEHWNIAALFTIGNKNSPCVWNMASRVAHLNRYIGSFVASILPPWILSYSHFGLVHYYMASLLSHQYHRGFITDLGCDTQRGEISTWNLEVLKIGVVKHSLCPSASNLAKLVKKNAENKMGYWFEVANLRPVDYAKCYEKSERIHWRSNISRYHIFGNILSFGVSISLASFMASGIAQPFFRVQAKFPPRDHQSNLLGGLTIAGPSLRSSPSFYSPASIWQNYVLCRIEDDFTWANLHNRRGWGKFAQNNVGLRIWNIGPPALRVVKYHADHSKGLKECGRTNYMSGDAINQIHVLLNAIQVGNKDDLIRK